MVLIGHLGGQGGVGHGGDREQQRQRRFSWNDGSDQPRGCDSGPISPSPPLALDKLHVGDTRVIAWLPFEGTVTYNKPLKP